MNDEIACKFWRKVEIIPFHECWEWSGNLNHFGYGRIDIKKKTYRAHRLSWELHKGPIPAGLLVCHHCDNPSCVRPEHLFLGTDGDNTRDRNAKGRANMPFGLSHHKRKLTESQILEIRSSEESSRTLARAFGVSHHNILCIKKRTIWRHL